MNRIFFRSSQHATAFFQRVLGQPHERVRDFLEFIRLRPLIVTFNAGRGSFYISGSMAANRAVVTAVLGEVLTGLYCDGIGITTDDLLTYFVTKDAQGGTHGLTDPMLTNLVATGSFGLTSYYMLLKDFLGVKKGTLILPNARGEVTIRYKKEIYEITGNQNILESVDPKKLEEVLKTSKVYQSEMP